MSSSAPDSIPASSPAGLHPTTGTVVFIDLAGFTALTDTHGDEQAVAVVDRFETTVRAALVDPAALIKFIGDAAMLVFPTSAEALTAIEQVLDNSASDGFPELRVGFHRGSITWRGDDPYGATVNVASRIAAHAAGGQVLASQHAAASLPEGTTTPLGDFAARGIASPIELVEVATSSTPTAIDPVCQMRVSRTKSAASIVYAGHRWNLCSLACARRFTANPDLYLAQLRTPVAPAGGTTKPGDSTE